MNRIRTALLALLTGACFPAGAQELKESFMVEGEYDIDVVRQERIATLPERVSFPLPASYVKPDLKGVIAPFEPSYTPLSALGWRDTRSIDSSRGYVDLGLGQYLNSTLSAGYRFVQDDRTDLSAMLQHNSTSLFHPRMSTEATDIRRWRYDESLGIHFSRRFGAGTLQADLAYRLACFNYYGIILPDNPDDPKAPTQTRNDLSLTLQWQSLQSAGSLAWSAGLAADYFAYRTDRYAPGLSCRGGREGDFALFGSLKFPWESGSALGLDLRAGLVAVNGDADNYGNVRLVPYYSFSRGRLLIRLGAELDITAKAGSAGDRFGAFHAAPDVRLDWQASGVGLYLHALGGTRFQTMKYLAALDYYSAPRVGSTLPVYTPLDAEAGISFGPFAGFRAQLSAAYRVSRNVALGGWYMSDLSYAQYGLVQPGLEIGDGYLPDSDPGHIDLHGLSVRLQASYELSDILTLEADASYQRQNGKTGFFNGFDRPEWLVNASATLRPIKPLSVTLAYNLRASSAIYAPTVLELPKDYVDPEGPAARMALPNWYDITLGARWSVTERFSIFGQAANLLCRRTPLLPMQPQEGFNFLLGFSVKF